jgi:predicted aspartyl protease
MKAKFILIIVCIHFQIFSQNVNFDSGTIQAQKYFEEISYELVNGKIILPVIINGKTYRFILDTGAPNIISKKILEELNIKQLNSINVSDANNLTESMQSVEIPNLKIGNLTFENQIALVYDFDNHNLLSCYKIDGFIGSNLLRNSSIKISKTDQKIFITDNVKNLNPKKKPSKIKLFGTQKAPHVEFNFVGKNKKKATDMVLIDTGMEGGYDMSNRAFNIFEKYKIFETIAKTTGVNSGGLFGFGKPNEHRLLQVETAKLNGIFIKNIIIETTSDNNSRIGLELLNYGDLILDFNKKNVYFEINDSVTLENKIPRYNAAILDNKYVIGMVWDENLAKQISYGDEIISIDSKKVSEISFCDILNLKNEIKNKNNYLLEIKNKENEIITINIQN